MCMVFLPSNCQGFCSITFDNSGYISMQIISPRIDNDAFSAFYREYSVDRN